MMAEEDPAERALRLTEILSQVTIKCMCRTYRATRTQPGVITFSDVTDITCPQLLGTAHHDGSTWEILSATGTEVLCTDELIRAVVRLRENSQARSAVQKRLSSREPKIN
jgi:hypothetical protein